MASRKDRATAASVTASRPLLERSGSGPPGRRRFISGRCFRILGIFVLVYLVYVLLSRNSPSNPPSKSPKHVEGQYVRRIVAVGDLHGDYDNALKVFHMADVVDANGSWTGNVDYLVQTGDIIDRGLDTIKLFKWMETLREQAKTAGGGVFSHLGNHEFMNALGDWRYVPQSEIATFGSVAKRQTALSTGFIGAAWAKNYTVASRIPLHPSSGSPFSDYNPSSSSSDNALSHASLSFMHGGLSPTFSHATPYPSSINALALSLLRRSQSRSPQPPPHPPAQYSGLPAGATQAEEELYGENGPLWYRGWATNDDQAVCSSVGPVLQKIGVRRLIMGHTPNFKKIVSRCGGRIIIIDTGISKAYGGALSALSITYTLTPVLSSFTVSLPPHPPDATQETSVGGLNSPTPSDVGSRPDVSSTASKMDQGKRTGQWIEREEVVAVYPGHRVELVVDERQVEGGFW